MEKLYILCTYVYIYKFYRACSVHEICIYVLIIVALSYNKNLIIIRIYHKSGNIDGDLNFAIWWSRTKLPY